MGRPHTTIRRWLKDATPEQAQELARRAKTSVPYLRHIAAGRRTPSCELARRLSGASGALVTKYADLYLWQHDLCDGCRVA
jgi:transcriptional regulator with XRE-family HTH domain